MTNKLQMNIKRKYEDEIAIYQLIANINADCFGVADKLMLGPNEMKHLLYWVIGYNKGLITWKKILKFLQLKLYNGEKNNGIYAVKKVLIDKKWIKMDDDLFEIHDVFKFEKDKIVKLNKDIFLKYAETEDQ